MVTGWLFYDSMHEGIAANTNPNGKNIWRATCEEIHPVSGIMFAGERPFSVRCYSLISLSVPSIAARLAAARFGASR
jgi:hypothetical protein